MSFLSTSSVPPSTVGHTTRCVLWLPPSPQWYNSVRLSGSLFSCSVPSARPSIRSNFRPPARFLRAALSVLTPPLPCSRIHFPRGHSAKFFSHDPILLPLTSFIRSNLMGERMMHRDLRNSGLHIIFAFFSESALCRSKCPVRRCLSTNLGNRGVLPCLNIQSARFEEWSNGRLIGPRHLPQATVRVPERPEIPLQAADPLK